MKKKMTFRKKTLAIFLTFAMAVSALSGCTGKEPEDPTVEAGNDDELEVPEVKGKEESVGAITLLVPKGMSADEDGSESCVLLTDDEDEDKYIRIQVAEKDEAKEYVKTLMEEDDHYSEEEFTIADVKWTGASYKKNYVLYGKVGKKTVFVTSEGFKVDDDITLAVLASLEVESDAETVAIGGAKGGTFTYGDGLYTVEYSGFYREAENSELGDLVATDGSQTVYVTAFDDMDDAMYAYAEIEEYDYDEKEMTVDGYEAYLCTYEDFFGDTAVEFFLPLEYVHQNGNTSMVCIYIHTTGDDYDAAVNDDFMALVNSVAVDESYMTDTEVGGGSSTTTTTPTGDVDDWYGTYSGSIVLVGNGSWEDEEYEFDDLYAVIGDSDGRPYFEGYSNEMDLWGGDWSREGTAVFSFWVELTEDKMTANTTDNAWILDDDDISSASAYLWWTSSEMDYITFTYDYYDPDYSGGFDVYIYLERD